MAFQHLTDDLLRTAIHVQADEFDSHDVILSFYRDHQAAYVREAAARADVGSYPVTELNRQIGLELLKYGGCGSHPEQRRGDPERRVSELAA